MKIQKNKRICDLAKSIPYKLLKPRLFQAKDKIKIKVFESGSLINLPPWLIRCSTMRRTFEVKPLVDPVLGAKHIPHYNKPGLFHPWYYNLHYILTGILDGK